MGTEEEPVASSGSKEWSGLQWSISMDLDGLNSGTDSSGGIMDFNSSGWGLRTEEEPDKPQLVRSNGSLDSSGQFLWIWTASNKRNGPVFVIVRLVRAPLQIVARIATRTWT